MILCLREVDRVTGRVRYCPTCGDPVVPADAVAPYVALSCGATYFPFGMADLTNQDYPGTRWRMSCRGPMPAMEWCWTPERGYFQVP